MNRQHFPIEDSDGQERYAYLETEGTTMDASPSFKWKCLVVLLGLAAAIALIRLLLEAIWG